MARGIRLLDVYVGSEGAALFRHLLEADDAFVEARLDNIRNFLDHAAYPSSTPSSGTARAVAYLGSSARSRKLRMLSSRASTKASSASSRWRKSAAPSLPT